MPVDLTEQLADFVARTTFSNIPSRTVDRAQACIADTVGVMIAGHTLGRGVREVVDVVNADGGVEESTIIGESRRIPARGAALANSSMTHQLDFDDTHDRAVVHPTANSLPVAMALAERVGGVTGRGLLEAVVIGNEVACRLGKALTGPMFDYPWVRPPVLGSFGGVAAGARVLQMSADETANAWGLLLPRVGGTLACLAESGSWVRTMRDAFSADSAVLALLLAQQGVQGERRPFEGPYGLFQVYFREEYEPDRLTEGLGSTYVTDEISLKPWPCCREVHGTLQALLNLIEREAIQPEDIEGIELRVGATNLKLCEPGEEKRHPTAATDALCNLPFNVAVAAVHRGVPLNVYSEAGLTDEIVAEMAERVTWTYDPDQERLGTLEPGAVAVTTRDGSTLEGQAEIARGHPEYPMTEYQLAKKFFDCFAVSTRLDAAAGQKLYECVSALDKIEDVVELTSFLRSP